MWGSLGEPGQGLQAITLKGEQGLSVCLSDQTARPELELGHWMNCVLRFSC